MPDDYIIAARARRRQLAKHIGDGALILTAAAQMDDNRRYRYNPYLYYLTACREPQSALLIIAEKGKLRREVFFCRPRDAKKEKWDGEMLGPLRARRTLQIKESADIAELPAALAKMAGEVAVVYYLPGSDETLQNRLSAIMAKRRTRGASVCLWQLRDAAFILDEMRLIKDKTEIARMRESARLTCLGHLAAMRAAGVRCEYHIESALFSEFKRGGGDNAFMPIIAAGANACTLHYIDNNAPVRRGQLVLADAGCQWRGYAADVSRVFPASGTFSPAQKAVYKVVLDAQRRAIKIIKPGITMEQIEKTALRALCAGLRALGLCAGSVGDIIKKQTYRRFYPHRIGHFLGMDVHDVGATKDAKGKPRPLQKGMVITVEPGLYIPADSDIPPPLRCMGIRIEDDVLITAQGCEVLTEAVPKTPAAIEKWQRGE